jgi:hypothetical protein
MVLHLHEEARVTFSCQSFVLYTYRQSNFGISPLPNCSRWFYIDPFIHDLFSSSLHLPFSFYLIWYSLWHSLRTAMQLPELSQLTATICCTVSSSATTNNSMCRTWLLQPLQFMLLQQYLTFFFCNFSVCILLCIYVIIIVFTSVTQQITRMMYIT